jgi:hypothetical protein
MIKEINGVKRTKVGHLFSEDRKVNLPFRVWGEGGLVKPTRKVNLSTREK